MSTMKPTLSEAETSRASIMARAVTGPAEHSSALSPFSPHTVTRDLEHGLPPPSYGSSVRIDPHQVNWTYDSARGLWITLEVPGCRVVGFGNDNTEATYPKFFIACTLEHVTNTTSEQQRIRNEQKQDRSFMRAAEALARYRRKFGCDCDFMMIIGRSVRARLAEASSDGGPINLAQRTYSQCSGRHRFWDSLRLIWTLSGHDRSCKERCMGPPEQFVRQRR